jgi:hypothetical protein
MIYEQNRCIICYEILVDSVCRKCYTKEIEVWLIDLKINFNIISFIFEKLEKNLSFYSFETPNNIKCIICHKEYLSICSYCFFSKTERILYELNFPKNLIKNFIETFIYSSYIKNIFDKPI